jgi:hypothetical protein
MKVTFNTGLMGGSKLPQNYTFYLVADAMG